MQKAVLDTNILVSGILYEAGPQAKLLRLAKLGKFEVFLSVDIVSELRDVLLRPKFNLTEKEVDSAIKELLKFCKIIVPSEKLNVVKADPDDNAIIEAAMAGKVHFIVSGDRHLLDIKKFRNVKIVNTFEFFKELAEQTGH